MYGAEPLPMTLPYSWFYMTITKTCEKAGTEPDPAGGGAGTGGWLAEAGPLTGATVAAGDGVGLGVGVATGFAAVRRCS